MRSVCGAAILLCWGLVEGITCGRADPPSVHAVFHAQLDPSFTHAASGRLLLFAVDAKSAPPNPKGGEPRELDVSPFHLEGTAVAAREVGLISPGRAVGIDADEGAFPAGFSRLPPGDYLVQAVLDVDHGYAYGGRAAGDLESDIVSLRLPAAALPSLTLTRTVPAWDPWDRRAASPAVRDMVSEARKHVEPVDFVSPSLSAFWGRPIHMLGRVLLPPGYDTRSGARYPTVYFTHGFGGRNDNMVGGMARVSSAMGRGQMPPMIWVFLDESSPTGTHEFADSVNNGPWGKALTGELIPSLEARYSMDARPSGRFLNGHSSGGWATLWLQTRYPKLFGGTWSTSPDPSDFHDFTGVDIYAPHANLYRRGDGSAFPLVRDHGTVLATIEQYARLERVLGTYGGQFESFDWVFSPRGRDGRPQEMFDRDTGAVDPDVAAYWRDHYDIARRLQAHWPELRRDLDGKIHVIVGTADTFYLDGAAHRLKAVLDALHAKSDIRFLPDRTHFDLYRIGDDPNGLLKRISWEMYAIARPNSKLKPPAAL